MSAIGFTSGDPRKVSVSGDTMTGALVLPGNPDAPLQAAPEQYVDAETTRAEAAEAGRKIVAPVAQINRGRASVITTYASGHGWTANGFASSNVNDTSDGRLSGQMLTGTTTGNASAFPTFTKTGASAISIAGNCLRVWVKVDVPTNVTAITLRVADTGGIAAGRYISWTALASSGGTYRTNGLIIPPNTWTELSFSLGSAFTAGSPNLAALTEYRWICQDNGTAFTAHFGGIEMYPALAGRYPNGVVCLGFDDCYAGQASLAMNLLSSFGYTATIFPIIDQIGQSGSWTLAQLQQMANIGWEVAPHAHTLANHTGWNSLTTAQVAADVAASKAWIAANGFGLSGMFAYPLGGFNDGFDAAVAPLVQVARTIDSTLMTETLPIGSAQHLRSAAGVGGSGGIGVSTYTTASTGVLALAKAAGALVPITIHDVSSGASGNINQISIADLTTLVTAINTAGMAVATYGEVLAYAMLGATPAAPISAADATITITGAQNAQQAKVTAGTFVTPSGGSATVAPTTAYAHRRDTLANWLANSALVLAAGEMAYETDLNCAKVGDGASTWAALPYLRTPGVWTASSSGLVAATGDGSIFPSQGPPTTGRPMFFPVRIDQNAAITNLITGYVNGSTPTLPTGSFLAMYACSTPGASGGALLGATADFSADVTPTQLELVLPIASNAAGAASSIPAQPIGAWVYFMLLTSYTGLTTAAAQYVAGRLFGTNLDGLVSGITPRVYTNSGGATMTTPPLAVPTLTQSNINVTSWMCAK
ncbi:MAG TPA: polysaccharide deacetylase family protein [Pseudonocardiaceae bacterium]|jgi:peptidoglycan/xylan/chitin deacetylase (PgdA/CDA1 family)|nr:polysaccharide deacetylase family protein [Pseudonocardiaceae bacterium]